MTRAVLPARALAAGALLAGATATACGPGEPGAGAGRGDDGAVTVALVDSVHFETELAPGWLRRVVVTRGARSDTLPGLLTDQLPVVQGDSLVLGFRQHQHEVLGTFAWAPATRTLRTAALPPDFYEYGTPAFAPDGRHVAYLGRDSTGAGYGVVVAWPSGAVRFRGAPVTLLPTDAGVDDIGWDDARTAVVAIALDAPIGSWQRTRVRLDPAGAATATVDTVAVSVPPPSWYSRARALDLTGDGVADSVRLDAEGTRADSLRLSLAFVVDGRVLHEERWGSDYELTILDSALRAPARVDSVLRARLDAVLAGVKVEPLSAPGVRLEAEDSAILARLAPRPTHRISVSYGFETTVRLAWDAPRRRFVRLWSCC